MFAFVDETGNTGRNLLDEAQPDFFTGALITKTNFDLVYPAKIAALAARFGGDPLHGKDLGFARVEEIADQLLRIFKKADARFFISRVQKRYLLATKIFDTFFDSGENAAVAWHHYNIRPLRLMLAFKVASLVTVEIARRFWDALLEKNEAKVRRALPEICQSLIDHVGELPDQRSRQIVFDALSWARDHPETIHLHLDTRQARNGHMPNMVAFANLLEGLEFFSKKWDRRVRRITHEQQSEFDKTLKEWHALHSTASDEPIHMPGEVIVFQKVVGSEFEIKKDSESAGIQAIDIVLWLYLQHTREADFPRDCARLMNYVFRHAWMNDFSYAGVEKQFMERFGNILSTPISAEQELEGRKLIEQDEARRTESMRQYEQDGVVPFMRKPLLAAEQADTTNAALGVAKP
jgi:hypothetical protein